MSIDLTLEEQEVFDHVRGKIVEPPNASAAARNKWTKGEAMFHQGSGTRGRGSEGARERPMQKLPTIF